MGKIEHVPNHQPVLFILPTKRNTHLTFDAFQKFEAEPKSYSCVHLSMGQKLCTLGTLQQLLNGWLFPKTW